MKLGLLVPQISTDIASAVRFAQECEEFDVDGVFAFDHRRAPGNETKTCLPIFPTLDAVASATSHITVGSCIARVDNIGTDRVVDNFAALRQVCGPRLFTGLGFGDRVTAREDEEAGVPRLDWPSRLSLLNEVCGRLSAEGHDVWLASKSPEVGEIAGSHGAGVLLWDPPIEHLAGREGSRFAWAGLLDRDEASATRQVAFIRSTGASWAICGMEGGLSAPGTIQAVLRAARS